jgi:hypothetical protein
MVIAFGAARSKRLHIHGASAATDSDELEAICRALVAAGGSWANERGGCYQLDIRPLSDADGWGGYLFKNVCQARRVTAHRPLWSMTNSTRRLAKALHGDLRARIKSMYR